MTHTLKIFDINSMPTPLEYNKVATFLHHHLDEFGDPQADIEHCINYALEKEHKPGGFIATAWDGTQIIGAVVINKTGMSGYIPENILVYIATHKDYRGQGLGKQLMKVAIEKASGDIALHVEPNNPARKLYEHFGFTNKYLEMRLKKEA